MSELDTQLSEMAEAPGVFFAKLAGVIDASTVNIFQNELEQARKNGVSRLVMDISKIRYINSTGLGAMVKFSDTFRTAGGGIVLVRVPAKVRIVIEMLGLHEFFEMCVTEQEAIGVLMGKAAVPAAAPAQVEEEPELLEPASAAPAPPVPKAEPAPAYVEPEEISAVPPAAPPAPPKPPAPKPRPAPAAPPAGEKAGFPIVVTCISCSVDMEVPGSGDFKCPRCMTVFSMDPQGKVNFSSPRMPLPIQMTLVTSPECTESFMSFFRAMSSRLNVPPAAINTALDGIEEVLTKIAREAYNAKPSTYHLLLVTGPDEFVLRTSDHGKTLDGTNLSTTFPVASKSFDELEIKAHPKGGNLVKMVKKIKR